MVWYSLFLSDTVKVASNEVVQDMLIGWYKLWKTLYLNLQCCIYKYDYIQSDTYNIGCSPHFNINLFRIILVQGLNSARSKPNRQFKPILNSPARHQFFYAESGYTKHWVLIPSTYTFSTHCSSMLTACFWWRCCYNTRHASGSQSHWTVDDLDGFVMKM